MSLPLTPYERWLPGTNQNSIPANNNSLRSEIFNTDGVSDAVTAQPGSPADGDWYILSATHTGAQWATFDPDSIAIYYSGTWYEFVPVEGNIVTVAGVEVMFDGSSGWVATGGGGVAVSSVNGDTGAVIVLQTFAVACSDLTTNLTTGTGKAYWYVPYNFTVVEVQASVDTVQTAGSVLTMDINESGTTILSTKLTIDNNEGSSITAATPPVISDSALTKGNKVTFDIDQVGTAGAKGLIVYVIGYPTA